MKIKSWICKRTLPFCKVRYVRCIFQMELLHLKCMFATRNLRSPGNADVKTN